MTNDTKEFKVMRFTVDRDDSNEFSAAIGTPRHFDTIRVSRYGRYGRDAADEEVQVNWYSSSSDGDLEYAIAFSHALSRAIRAALTIEAGTDPDIALKGAGFEFAS